LSDLSGKTIGEYPAQRRTMHEAGRFYLAEAQWPIDAAPPGQHTAVAVLYDRNGNELTRVAPRLMSAGWVQGY
jgi:hypothetical protein